MTPALDYLNITNVVQGLIVAHSGNDKTRAAYMIMRAALLHVRAEQGSQVAAQKAVQLADEMTVT